MKKLLFLAIAVSAIGSLLAGDNYVPSYQGYFNGAESFDANGSRVMTPRVIVASTTAPSTTQRTLPAAQTTTTSGTISAGTRWTSFTLSSNFTGSINSGAYSAASVLNVPFVADPSGVLPAIPYVVTTGTLIIQSLQ